MNKHHSTGLICEPCGHSCINLPGLAQLQLRKHGKDRYPTTVVGQFAKLVEEMGELAKELAKELNRDRPDMVKLEGELADCTLALFNVAEKCGVDLLTAVESKVYGDKRKFK